MNILSILAKPITLLLSGLSVIKSSATIRWAVIVSVLLVASVALNTHQCHSIKAKNIQLRMSEGLISRLREDSSAFHHTISTATAKISVNYATQVKALQADSVHAASLPLSQLERENDSLLSVNRQFIRNRATTRNQPATP